MKKLNNNQGFTLIEMLVSILIFGIFVGILIGSYVEIIKEQRKANDYRLVYSQSRRIFEVISDEVKNGNIFYPVLDGISYNPEYNSGNSSLKILDKDGAVNEIMFDVNRGVVLIKNELGEREIDENFGKIVVEEEDEISGVVVKELNFYVSPAGDPYLEENVYIEAFQFQPKVTVEMTVGFSEREDLDVSLRTTISSRIYR